MMVIIPPSRSAHDRRHPAHPGLLDVTGRGSTVHNFKIPWAREPWLTCPLAYKVNPAS
jgi:hypothetical protein